MALMIPQRGHRASSTDPFVVERKFALTLRCNGCAHESSATVSLVDEPREPGTVEDFYGSGVLERMAFSCDRCGAESATVIHTSYVRQPLDLIMDAA